MNRTRINKSITNLRWSLTMSVALIRDGVIRPSKTIRMCLPPCCPRPARKTTREYSAFAGWRVNVRLVCGNAEGIADISVWGSRLPAGGMQ